MVEHIHGKDEVPGSIPGLGSSNLIKTVKIFWHLYVRNPILFVGQAITNWAVVGSIFPTSAPLRRAVIAAGIGRQKDLNLVIIHGVGSGEFVYELLRQAHEQGLAIKNIVAMDVNAKFTASATALLPKIAKRYPSRTKVTFEKMDALDTTQYLARRKWGKADLVIGAIPYSILPEQLDAWAKVYGEVTRRFVYYTYLPIFKQAKHKVAMRTFAHELGKHFESVHEHARVLANIPPAKVISAENL